MAKKFGKFVMFAAAVGAAGAAAYYYMQKKDSALTNDENDEDYDDFSDTSEETDTPSRTYVSLNLDSTAETPVSETAENSSAAEGFASAADQTVETADLAKPEMEETVEEFFDEADSSDEEPPRTEVE